VRSAIRFLHYSGVRKIRFTGGEPTMYRGLIELVSFAKSIDEKIHTAITSNGLLLETMVEPLAAAGLDSLNISLDTLVPQKFKTLTGRDYMRRVIMGIDAALEHIDKVKLNTVLMRGINDDEVEQLVAFGSSRGLDVRFIEFMPNRFSPPGDLRFISNQEIRGRLPWDLRALPSPPDSAARYFTSPVLNNKIGFISPVSHPFCMGCNRIRLTAGGLLYSCLYDSAHINLFELLASGSQRARIEFNQLMTSKQFRGTCSSYDSTSSLPSFSAIGG
jgi:cyclic pyranopterin phosphate synthase